VFFDCNNNELPLSFACDPLDLTHVKPSLSFAWRHSPPGTSSFVLMMDDVTEKVCAGNHNESTKHNISQLIVFRSKDEQSQLYGRVHWLVTGIPANETFLCKHKQSHCKMNTANLNK
jgi:phosphatidylethanolamine-binding protein (PEBP) family uncharacterized protein